MKIITGEAPHLPWWRARLMTKAEIEEYNSKFMKVEEMMDDNLSDVQQMSVKELKMYNIFGNGSLIAKREGDCIKFDAECMGLRVGLNFDRNQAHLLKLWLEEHLR